MLRMCVSKLENQEKEKSDGCLVMGDCENYVRIFALLNRDYNLVPVP